MRVKTRTQLLLIFIIFAMVLSGCSSTEPGNAALPAEADAPKGENEIIEVDIPRNAFFIGLGAVLLMAAMILLWVHRRNKRMLSSKAAADVSAPAGSIPKDRWSCPRCGAVYSDICCPICGARRSRPAEAVAPGGDTAAPHDVSAGYPTDLPLNKRMGRWESPCNARSAAASPETSEYFHPPKGIQ